ncbi:MAG: AzlC family ABC transporter permease [Burkholderiaceae bacterium]
MFFLRDNHRHPEFRVGARDFQRLAPGIVAWGLMTGVAMVKSGMGVTEAVLMSLLVFAGSAQLAAVPLLLAGAPVWVILATGFCVNLRFVVFSLHLRSYLSHLPRWQRMGHGYFTADMSYVLFTSRFEQPATDEPGRKAQEAYLAGNDMVNWLSWVGSSLLGVLLSNLIPQQWGLGFAGILCLVGILCSLATSRLRVLAAVMAAVAGVLAYALPLKLNILAGIAAAVVLCLGAEKIANIRARSLAG